MSIPYIQNTKKADFKIFAPLLKTSRSPDGKLRLHGVASSSIKDRQGDKINLTALSEMERSANENMTIFLNHEYKVPEDVAGSVERAVMRASATDPDIHDLAFDIVINESNERAVKAWEAIDGGTKLGLSIGARIPDGGAKRDRATGTYQIDHLDLLETSLVGVPANPRSWVEYAVKSLNAIPQAIEAELGETVTITGDGPLEAPLVKEIAVEDLPPEDEPEADDTNEEEEAQEPDEVDPEVVLARGGTVNSATFTVGENGPELIAVTETMSNSTTDITDATVNIKTPYADVTIDTGNRGSKPDATSGSSQEALASVPENEGEDDTAVTSPWAGLLPVKSEDTLIEDDVASALRTLEPTVVASLHSSSEVLKAVTRELIDTKAALRQRDDEYRALEAMTTKVVANMAQILDKLSNTPVGRRAVLREAHEQFASLGAVYGDDFLTLLKRS